MQVSIEQELERLAVLRGSWREIEDLNKGLLDDIKELEAAIKAEVAATGAEAMAGGLRVSFAAGRVTFDGKTLHDVGGHLLDGLRALEGDVWGYAEQAPEMVEKLTQHFAGMRALLERALGESKKQGEKTIRITEQKEKVQS